MSLKFFLSMDEYKIYYKTLVKFRNEIKISFFNRTNLKVTIKSWKDGFEKAQLLFLLSESNNDSYILNQNSDYFKDKISEYIFYLLELNGEIQMKKLKISKIHYKDKNKAKEWRNNLIKMLHPDISFHAKTKEATEAINLIYKAMIK